MKNVKQNISTGLQLHVKWVRIMLIVSVVAVLGLLIYPNPVREKVVPIRLLSAPSRVNDDSTAVAGDTVHRVGGASRTIASEPIEIRIVKEKESFDWKGTITWAIGAINGFVLIFLNIKNLVKKK